MDFELMATTESALFAASIPKLDTNAKFSYGWAGRNMAQEHTPAAMRGFEKAKTVKEYMDAMDMLAKDGWSGVGMNLVLADNQGNIGYMMCASIPVRKDTTPHIGSRVLDGSKSVYDWESGRNVPLSDLPRSFNPEKGYIVTANNRHVSDHAKHDYGANPMSTARSIRITDMIE